MSAVTRPRIARIPILIVLALAVAGCGPVALKTQSQPFDACEDALLAGSLASDARTGLGIASGDGAVTPVLWPFGYSARNDLGKVALVDPSGAVVAHVGDRVEVPGGLGVGDAWNACGSGIRLVRNEGGG